MTHAALRGLKRFPPDDVIGQAAHTYKQIKGVTPSEGHEFLPENSHGWGNIIVYLRERGISLGTLIQDVEFAQNKAPKTTPRNSFSAINTEKLMPRDHEIYEAAIKCRAEDPKNRLPPNGRKNLPENSYNWTKIRKHLQEQYNMNLSEFVYAIDLKHKLLNAFETVAAGHEPEKPIAKTEMIYATIFHRRMNDMALPENDLLGVEVDKLGELFKHHAIEDAQDLDLSRPPKEILKDYLVDAGIAERTESDEIQPSGFGNTLQNMLIRPPKLP